MRFNLLKV